MSVRKADGAKRGPEEIAAEILGKLQIAMDEIEGLQRVLRGEEQA